MGKKKKSVLVSVILTVFIATGMLPGLISAGDLEPPGPPGPTTHTLEEIYDKVANIGSAPVEKTGQTSSSGTGDDGDWEKGVSWPTPRFTDNGDGTVTDNLTGLIWLKNANRFAATKTWAEALSACNSLADDGTNLTDGSTAGQWRLPNIKELQSLLHYGVYNPALPDTAGTGKWSEGNPFTGVQSLHYWSSTPYDAFSDHAWHVCMYNGYTYYYHKSHGYHVWPVRAGN